MMARVVLLLGPFHGKTVDINDYATEIRLPSLPEETNRWVYLGTTTPIHCTIRIIVYRFWKYKDRYGTRYFIPSTVKDSEVEELLAIR